MQDDLLRAIGADDEEAVRRLIADGANVDAVDEDGPYPLEAALDAGHEAVFWAMLEDAPAARLEFGLCLAADVGAVAIVERLLAMGVPANAEDDGDGTALEYAATGQGPLDRRLFVARLLLAAGADPQGAISVATDRREEEMLRLLNPSGRVLDPDDAIRLGDVAEVRHSLGDAAPTEMQIVLAAKTGQANVLEFLLGRTAERPEMAMNLAIGAGQAGTVRVLLRHGFDPEGLDSDDPTGETLLMVAAIQGQDEVIEALLAAGARADARTPAGVTPLMRATLHGHLGAVERLLAAGADPNVAQRHQGTPLDAALRSRRADLVAALRGAGGRPSV